MEDIRKTIGNKGEARAASFLAKKGYILLGSQVRTPVGEIDLVCMDGSEYVFVEVKTRYTHTYGHPEEAITRSKFSHMVRSAETYLSDHNLVDVPWRLDVIAIDLSQDTPEVVHFEGVDGPCGF